jgi:hypothetical protein
MESASVNDAELDVPMYSIDPVVRRGSALQKTSAAREAVES